MSKRRAAKKGENLHSFVKPTEKRKLLARKPGVPVDIQKRKATLQEVATRVRRIEGATLRTASIAQNGEFGGKKLDEILKNTDKIVRSFTVDRSFLGRNVSITTTPQEIVPSSYARGYRLINPAQSAGLTSQGVVQAATTSVSGNTQSSSLGVANYRRLRLFLNITAITGSALVVDAQSQLPTSQVASTWVTTQGDVFGSPTTTGQYYADVDTFGVDFAFAISWSGPTSVNFSVGYVLKDGLVGSAGGLTQTVYIGSGNGVNSTNGFPLLEGQEFSFFSAENMSLWAVSEISGGITLKIFELQ